jgi:2-hydroxy-3-oxopropionate reductase
MGLPMAKNLLRSGFKLNAWNRTRERTSALYELGAKISPSPAAAIRKSNIVITMLLNAAVVEKVLFDDVALSAIKSGSLVIDMSSIPPKIAQNHSRRLSHQSIRHLDAPVSGGTGGAEAATLAIMVGGDPADFSEAKQIFLAMGSPTHVGPSGTGQIAKCTNQAIVSIVIAAVAEGLLFATAGGADARAVHKAIQGGFADSRILREHGQRMLNREFQPGGPITDQIKDIDTILDAANEFGVELPVCRYVRQFFVDVDHQGKGGLDHSALILALEKMNPGLRLGRDSTTPTQA